MSSSLVDIAKGLSNNSNNTVNIKVYDYDITLDKDLVEKFESYFYDVNSKSMEEALLAYQYFKCISNDTASRIVTDYMNFKINNSATSEELSKMFEGINYDKIFPKAKL